MAAKRKSICYTCFNCRTRVYRRMEDIKDVGDRWASKLVEGRELRGYWCAKGVWGPRLTVKVVYDCEERDA